MSFYLKGISDRARKCNQYKDNIYYIIHCKRESHIFLSTGDMNGLSTSFRDSMLPVIVLLAAFDIFGFVGNIIVVYVYTFRYTKNRFRCLVLAMGLVDLTSCLTTIPLEVISTWLWLNFPSRELCKVKSFFIQFTENSAMYLLFITAVYKYRQICIPFSTQITQKSIVISCAVGILFAAIFAAPSAIMWDINIHNLTFYNSSETVLICEVNKDLHNTIYPTVYEVALSLYILFLLATVVLYIFVARTTIQHNRRLQRHHRRPAPVFDNPVFTVEQYEGKNRHETNARINNETTLTPQQIMETNPTSQKTPGVSHETPRRTVSVQTDVIITSPTTSVPRNDIRQTPSSSQSASKGIIRKSSNSIAKHNGDKKPSASQLTPNRIPKVTIMVILAGTFSVTFFLAIGIGYVFAVRDFDEYESLSHLVIFFCMYRFYFINYCLNPVVYFVLDGQFRKGVKDLITCHVAERSM